MFAVVRSSAWVTLGVYSDMSHCIGADTKHCMHKDLIVFVGITVVATVRAPGGEGASQSASHVASVSSPARQDVSPDGV